jgi:hypothetical protein
MLVVEGERAELLEMSAAAGAFRPLRSFADASMGTVVRELEQGLATKAFWRLVIVAEARRLEELAGRMTADLRAAISMQCSSGELELPPDEVEARFRRLRSALAFVA